MSTTRRVAAGLAVLLAGVLALLLLWPDGEVVRQLVLRIYLFGLRRGVSPGVDPDVYAAALNVVVFVPLGVIGVVLLHRRVVTVALSLLAVTAAVELVQAVPVFGRDPSLLDVACNAVGGLLGALLGSALARRRELQHPGVDETRDEPLDPGADVGR